MALSSAQEIADAGSADSTTSKDAMKSQLRELINAGLTQHDIISALHEAGTGSEVDSKIAIRVARNIYRSGVDLEIDSNALFSAGDDGLWVSAWVWVPNDKLGIKKPLPEQMKGKLWLVPLINKTASPIESFSDAVDIFDDITADQIIVKADCAGEAVAIAGLFLDKYPSVELAWQDGEDDCYGFFYARGRLETI